MNIKQYCTFYIVRHGETEWNTIDRIQGQLDSPLIQNGITQVEEVGKKLKDVKFDAIFSSDLLRAKRTARIINVDRKLKIATTKALRERTFGKHDGSMGNDYSIKIKNLLKEYDKLSHEQKWKFKFAKDYESDEELITRFITFLKEVAVAFIGKTILIVTHGGNMRTFLTRLGYAEYGRLTPGTVKNAGYIVVISSGVDFLLKKVEGVDMDRGIKIKTL